MYAYLGGGECAPLSSILDSFRFLSLLAIGRISIRSRLSTNNDYNKYDYGIVAIHCHDYRQLAATARRFTGILKCFIYKL